MHVDKIPAVFIITNWEMDYFLSAITFLIITAVVQTDLPVMEVEAQNNLVSVAFNRDIDTCVNVFSAINMYPGLFGYWKWRSNRELDFISDSFIPDTAVYILNINSKLKDITGNSIGPTGSIFTVSKIYNYNCHEVPFQWEGYFKPDAETDWRTGLKYSTFKSKYDWSYTSMIDVISCWDHVYNGTLRMDHASSMYQHFITSESQIYEAAVDSSGALYLNNRPLRLQYRWFIFPKNQFYRALDVSDKGEILIALSTNEADTMSMIYLFSPAAEIIWAKKFYTHNHNGMIDLSFMNTAERFVIHIDERIYCFKMQRFE